MTGHCVIQPSTGRQARRGRQHSGLVRRPERRGDHGLRRHRRTTRRRRSLHHRRVRRRVRRSGSTAIITMSSASRYRCYADSPQTLESSWPRTVGAVASKRGDSTPPASGSLPRGTGRPGSPAQHLRAVGDAGRHRRRRLHQPRLRPDAVGAFRMGHAPRQAVQHRHVASQHHRHVGGCLRRPQPDGCDVDRHTRSRQSCSPSASACSRVRGRSVVRSRGSPWCSSSPTRCWPPAVALETTAAVTLIVWLLARAGVGDWRGYGWLCGFGLLLRPDLVLVMAIVWLFHPAMRRPDAAGRRSGRRPGEPR